MELLTSLQLWQIIKRTLSRIDSRLVHHGERVAFMVWRIMQVRGIELEKMTEIVFLCLMHDIGAYKTEEIDRLVEFETTGVWEHSVYGALYLARLSPIPHYANALLYHHCGYQQMATAPISEEHRMLAALIHFVDGLDVLGLESQLANPRQGFDQKAMQMFEEADQRYRIKEALNSGAFEDQLEGFIAEQPIGNKKTRGFLELIAHSIDFRSPFMVAHTITVVAFACQLGRLMGCSEQDIHRLYYGMLLHDLGKVATPVEILEKPGRLTAAEMQIMRKHIEISEEILTGCVREDICKIAIRHHERVDGTGYPHQINGEELTLLECIGAVADVLSALALKRSYKEEMPAEQVISILRQMVKDGHLCPVVGGLAADQYESLWIYAKEQISGLLAVYSTIMPEYDRLFESQESGQFSSIQLGEMVPLFELTALC